MDMLAMVAMDMAATDTDIPTTATEASPATRMTRIARTSTHMAMVMDMLATAMALATAMVVMDMPPATDTDIPATDTEASPAPRMTRNARPTAMDIQRDMAAMAMDTDTTRNIMSLRRSLLLPPRRTWLLRTAGW